VSWKPKVNHNKPEGDGLLGKTEWRGGNSKVTHINLMKLFGKMTKKRNKVHWGEGVMERSFGPLPMVRIKEKKKKMGNPLDEREKFW